MRCVFFGTPAIAVPALRALHELTEVAGVVCQPDRPAGRGLELRSPAVKLAAIELGLDVYQPLKVRNGELEAWLKARVIDAALVMAYGRILPTGVLSAPHHGCLNLHASLLPRYRGAAPIQWSVINGETETGISLMQMDEGLDTGPVYSMASISIGPNETSGELSERMASLAAEVVRRDLLDVLNGTRHAHAQDASRASHAPPLEKQHQILDFSRSSQALHNQVRGLAPKPGALTRVRGKSLAIRETRLVELSPALAPGEVRVERPRVLIGTGQGALELVRAQLEGKRELAALELVNGRALVDGDRLG